MSYDYSQRAPISRELNSSMVNFLKNQRSVSFVVIDPESSRNILAGKERQFTPLTLKKYSTNDLSDARAGMEILDALREGSLGIQHEDGKVAFKDKYSQMLAKAKVVIAASSFSSHLKKSKKEGSSGIENRQTNASPEEPQGLEGSQVAEESTDLKKTKHAEFRGNAQKIPEEAEIDEENEEIETISNFDVISDEDYSRFLAQINKIMDLESHKEDISTDKTDQKGGRTLMMPRDFRKNKNSNNQIQKPVIAKKASSQDREDEISERVAGEREARLEASHKRDEKAAEKKRLFIKSDLTKSEIRSSEVVDSVKVDSIKNEKDIDKSVLNDMLKNNEISEEAKKVIETSANIDETFLGVMLKENLINIEAYNKFIKMLAG